jgi:hypothetical protein
MVTRENLYRHKQTHTKQNSWWLLDAKGIELNRVCDECVDVVESLYEPEVLGKAGRYEDVVDEPVDEEG